MTIDIIAPLRDLEKLAADTKTTGEFRNGYLMAIGHAIELAETQQKHIALLDQWFQTEQLGKIQLEMKRVAGSDL